MDCRPRNVRRDSGVAMTYLYFFLLGYALTHPIASYFIWLECWA